MNESEKTQFKENTLQKAAGPDKLDGYLKVTGFGPWFVLAAAAFVLAAVIIWAFFGTIRTQIAGAGYSENGVLTCYVPRSEIGAITAESTATAGGAQGTVREIDSDLYSAFEVPREILALLPAASWYSMVQLTCPLEDGLYSVTFSQKSSAPFSLMIRGE